jgi:hypothetical protein
LLVLEAEGDVVATKAEEIKVVECLPSVDAHIVYKRLIERGWAGKEKRGGVSEIGMVKRKDLK